MSTVLIVVGVAAVVALVAGRKTIGRVFAAATGQLNKGGRAIWAADPIAVYQKQVDDAAEEIKNGTKGLEQYRGLVSRLQRQVESDQKEAAIYDARARTHVQAGRDKEATEALVQKKKVEASLSENRTQLNLYQENYQASLKKIQYAQKKIADAKQEAQKLQADLRLSQAEAEISKLAQSFSINTSSLNALGEVKEEIQHQIDANRAKSQVARDLGNDGLAEIEADETARAAAAADDLAKLKAEIMGGGCNSGAC